MDGQIHPSACDVCLSALLEIRYRTHLDVRCRYESYDSSKALSVAFADLLDDTMLSAVHPCVTVIRVAQHEQNVQNGLGNREPAVCTAITRRG